MRNVQRIILADEMPRARKICVIGYFRIVDSYLVQQHCKKGDCVGHFILS